MFFRFGMYFICAFTVYRREIGNLFFLFLHYPLFPVCFYIWQKRRTPVGCRFSLHRRRRFLFSGLHPPTAFGRYALFPGGANPVCHPSAQVRKTKNPALVQNRADCACRNCNCHCFENEHRLAGCRFRVLLLQPDFQCHYRIFPIPENAPACHRFGIFHPMRHSNRIAGGITGLSPHRGNHLAISDSVYRL